MQFLLKRALKKVVFPEEVRFSYEQKVEERYVREHRIVYHRAEVCKPQ